MEVIVRVIVMVATQSFEVMTNVFVGSGHAFESDVDETPALWIVELGVGISVKTPEGDTPIAPVAMKLEEESTELEVGSTELELEAEIALGDDGTIEDELLDASGSEVVVASEIALDGLFDDNVETETLVGLEMAGELSTIVDVRVEDTDALSDELARTVDVWKVELPGRLDVEEVVAIGIAQ
jgi:hypothetical protein